MLLRTKSTPAATASPSMWLDLEDDLESDYFRMFCFKVKMLPGGALPRLGAMPEATPYPGEKALPTKTRATATPPRPVQT